MDNFDTINDGITKVWTYGNIAVTVLFLCLIGSAIMNLIMYRDNRKERREMNAAMLSMQKDGSAAMMAVKDAFSTVQTTLAIIKDRLGHDE